MSFIRTSLFAALSMLCACGGKEASFVVKSSQIKLADEKQGTLDNSEAVATMTPGDSKIVALEPVVSETILAVVVPTQAPQVTETKALATSTPIATPIATSVIVVDAGKSSATPSPTPMTIATSRPTATPVPPSLKLDVSEVTLSAGQKQSFVPTVVGLSSYEIKYQLSGQAGFDIGTIGKSGEYVAPSLVTSDYPFITLDVSVLNSPELKAKVKIRILPTAALVYNCETSGKLPIAASLFELPSGTSKLPDFSKMSPLSKDGSLCVLNFDVPTRSFSTGFPGVSDRFEWFGLRFTGKIAIAKAGTYTFRTFSDDGSILSIDGSVVVNHDGTHGPTSKSGTVTLSQGYHPFVFDYFQGPRTQIALQLFWTVPGHTEVIVPPSAFQNPSESSK